MGSRHLTSEEINLAASVYGNLINYSSVLIYDEKFNPFQADNQAITPFGNIYTGSAVSSSNFANEAPSRQALFIHELGHVFQKQHGMDVVTERLKQGSLYNYDAVFTGTPLAQLPVEAQAEFFEDLFRKRNEFPVDAEKNGDGTLIYPDRPLSEYEAVLPGNFPGGNPNIPSLDHFDPSPTPYYNSSLPINFGILPSSFAPVVGMQTGYGQFVTTHSPLVLDLNGDGAHSTKLGWGAGASATYFDMDNDGFAERTAWISSGDGLLVMDKNGNGKIDGQSELFGNNTTYANGFFNLKQYDSNNDNKITSADAQWNNLRVWVDANSDAKTDAGELKTLASLGITQINLSSTTLTNTLDNENTVTDRSTFIMNGQTRNVDDIWFRVDQTSSHYMGDVSLNIATLFLPTLKGFGNLKDLHVAMSSDVTLLNMMQGFVSTTTTSDFKNVNTEIDQKVEDILYRWAGVDGIPADNITQGINTRIMNVLEKITGYKTSLLEGVPADQSIGHTTPSVVFGQLVQNLKAQLLVQIFGSQLFEGGGYNLATGETSGLHISSVGAAKIGADLASFNASEKAMYWIALTNFLNHVKLPTDYTPSELSLIENLWAATGPYSNTWQSYATSQYYIYEWSFSGGNLSDYLVGPENASNTIYGLGGDDYILGGYSTNWLYGGDGNDRIISRSANGDDIQGGNGDDFINGGGGDNYLRGEAGNDTYHIDMNAGVDTIYDMSGSDTIEFGIGYNPSQFSFQIAANGGDLNLLFGAEVVAVIVSHFSGQSNIETIKFADGSIFNLANYAFTKTGTSGADAIIGHNGTDIIKGLAGNDILNGAGGNDTYVFNIGDGQDNVTDDGGTNDVILMGTGITASNIRFENSGNALSIYYGTTDRISLDNQFYDDSYGTNNYDEIETLKFADGSTINLKAGLTFTGTSTNETVNGTGMNDILNGLAGNDYLFGENGNDTLNGGTGNDTLYGGLGNDTYVFNIGDGQDSVNDDGGTGDIVLMGAGITASNIRLESSSNALYIYYGTTDRISLDNQFYDDSYGTNNYDEIETLKFADGSTINLKAGLTFTGTSTNETVNGTGMNDILNGLAGNDYLFGKNGNDTLNGGTGNDTLYGGLGNDTYVFNIGDGQDSVNDDGGTGDIILMGAGITASNIRLESSSNALYIYYGTTDRISLDNQFYDDSYGTNNYDEIETLKFADGSTINLKAGLTFTGTSTSDSVNGTSMNDVLVGLAGNDYLFGKNGNDTLNGGTGNDTLDGGDGNDTASYSDATAAVIVDLSITSSQNTGGAGTDTLSSIESLIGSAYNDTLTGDGNANIIEGGLGNDILNGAGGIDTVSYASATTGVTVNLSLTTAQNTVGAGTDTITAFENILGSAYNDTLTGDANANTITGGDGNDVIQGGLGNDVLIGGNGVDTVSYSAATAGVTVNLALTTAQNTVSAGTDTISNFENIFASAFNDTLTGNSAANTINGGAGNDTIIGGLGADILTGGLGADTFQFLSTGLDTNFDRITDFSTAQADKIDIKNLLVGYDAVTKAITDYVEFTTVGANTVIKIDRDGLGSTYGWQQIAQLDNVTGLTDEAVLKASGNLVVA